MRSVIFMHFIMPVIINKSYTHLKNEQRAFFKAFMFSVLQFLGFRSVSHINRVVSVQDSRALSRVELKKLYKNTHNFAIQ